MIQHEVDHLDGVLILDRISREARKEAMRAMREAQETATRPSGRPRALEHRLPRHRDFAAEILERLADAASTARPSSSPGRIAARSRPSARAAAGSRAARALGLALGQPDSVNDPQTVARIADGRAEAVVVCAFGALIKEPLLSAHELLNVHPSLLPRWRAPRRSSGRSWPATRESGVSIMRLTAGLDSGPVCLAGSQPIDEHDTYGSLPCACSSSAAICC